MNKRTYILLFRSLKMLQVNSAQVLKNWMPLLLMGMGMFLATLYMAGAHGNAPIAIFTAIAQGIVCAGMAVFGYEACKGTKKNLTRH